MSTLKEYNNNVYYSTFIDKKFKFNVIIVSFIVELNKDFATENAIIVSLLRSRCKKFSNLELGKKLRSLFGAELFCDVEKKGNKQVLSFGINFLEDTFALEKQLVSKEAFDLLKEIIFHPAFKDGMFFKEDVEIEKQNLKDIFKSLYADKKSLAFMRAEKFLFEGTNFEVGRYGDFEHIDKVSLVGLKDAYINLINKSRVFVFYGGYKNYQREFINFLGSFTTREEKNIYSYSLPKTYFFEKLKQKQEEDDVLQSKVVLGFAGFDGSKRLDFLDHTKNFVMGVLFGGAATSLLFTNVREKLSLCYYCHAFYDSFTGVLWVESGVETKNIDKVISAILEQFEVLKRGDFKKEQLDSTISAIENSYNIVEDSIVRMAKYNLNSFLKGEKISLAEKINIIKCIKIEDIVDAANKFVMAVKYVLKAGN